MLKFSKNHIIKKFNKNHKVNPHKVLNMKNLMRTYFPNPMIMNFITIILICLQNKKINIKIKINQNNPPKIMVLMDNHNRINKMRSKKMAII